MANYEFPTGTPYWSYHLDDVKEALNTCDTTFPLGIVECVVEFDNPDDIICPLLSHHTNEGHLVYTVNSERVIKTTIDIMEAVKYNKARVVEVSKALLWADCAPIFRKAIQRLFNMRKQAKKIKTMLLLKQ
jgi:KaiC/GvpD/RAD55 family RecA-like ATPase